MSIAGTPSGDMPANSICMLIHWITILDHNLSEPQLSNNSNNNYRQRKIIIVKVMIFQKTPTGRFLRILTRNFPKHNKYHKLQLLNGNCIPNVGIVSNRHNVSLQPTWRLRKNTRSSSRSKKLATVGKAPHVHSIKSTILCMLYQGTLSYKSKEIHR